MTSSFLLFNLPFEAILHVLKSMDYGEFIAISLLSKRAKQSVESMNLYCRKAFAFISNPIRLFMYFDEAGVELRFTADNVSEEQTSGSLSLTKKMELEIYINRLVKIELSMIEVCIKKWFNHLNAVFHFSELNCLQFGENTSRFDIKELQIMFCSYDVLRISSDNESDLKSILKHFPTRRLFFDNDVFNHLENPYPVLIQNYDKLVIDPDMESPNTLQFDDLLIINSKTIEIYNMNWTVKKVNRLLKHWIKGSNPRMERLAIHFFSLKVTNLFEILKGIKYVEMPAEHTRWFKSCKGFEAVRGGHDFYRCDGTKATLTIPAYTTHMVEMYVWYPHCVGEVEEMEN
ncbi:hypothetical protein GCK72_008492 [Caenorhabditis remanei]|uniref:F-box domain-containing protein n=1 Tax=Caenorhabditis remanei TaxID=31234 RepID=A0A6A5H0F2_CAERE|nr:hypothetical protein GCK72_008492 [Caenorhabditis remanei]KAF1760246.1 hypothetical protein GCK72_008492 [Caenorhabditis remanei]